MKPKIHLVLTHDWELRGDGSGDIEEIQFAPMRRLLEIYRQHNVRTTFLPDVMQQVRFRQLQSREPALEMLADKWDEHVRQAFCARHDVQLHLHPHWSNAVYQNGRWKLAGNWAIVNYDRQTAFELVAVCKNYLETLLAPLGPGYRCLAFRAGALAAAPSQHLFESLVKLGIEIDVSIAPGLIVNDPNLELDYHDCDETFLPYYPSLDDARKVSDRRQNVVCIPLNYFYGSRAAVTRQNISLVRQRLSGLNRSKQAGSYHETGSTRLSRTRRGFEKLIKPALSRKYFLSDTGRLNYRLMHEMIASIRARANECGLSHIPVVLTNHPKDIRDWPGLERFVGELSQAQDLQFDTLSDVAESIARGEIEVRSREDGASVSV